MTSAEASMVLTHIDAQRVYDFDDACAHLDEAIAAGARPIDLPPVPRGTILSAPVTPPTIITLLASLLEEQRAGSTLLRQVLAQLQWNAGAPQPGDTDEEFN
ncbi:hypothetical protein ROS9278_01164 [Roseomonas sp. CECT 9278]|nr:hypothetical protein ROS9278_01164 [Roseomonas sp. CECT 9278]